jgi:hypothetical protein
MFKQKSTFIPALMLGGFLVASVALTSCNNEGEKAAEPATETKMDTISSTPAPDTTKPAVVDTAKKAMDTTASTKPIKTAP